MIIYIGADHRGFALKEFVKRYLDGAGYTCIDVGNSALNESDSYVDFAKLVAQEVGEDVLNRRGILFCGSGAGMCVVANKFPGIRASIVFSSDHAISIKGEDDINVLCVGADFFEEKQVTQFIATWLQTPFAQEQRYRDRIEQIRHIEVDRGLWT